MTVGQVCCRHKLYVVKEIVWNHIKSIEQVLTDPLIKGLPLSVFGEHMVDMGL